MKPELVTVPPAAAGNIIREKLNALELREHLLVEEIQYPPKPAPGALSVALAVDFFVTRLQNLQTVRMQMAALQNVAKG